MKEHPILFKAPMVLGILDGRKSQTRRIVDVSEKGVLDSGQRKIGFEFCKDPSKFRYDYPVKGMPRLHVPILHPNDKNILTWDDTYCSTLHPRWQVGDRLWVRETWGFEENSRVVYAADKAAQYFESPGNPLREIFYLSSDYECKWRPSIHMPRWASRITLEITDLRVERVQDISEADAKAEGVNRFAWEPEAESYKRAFQLLWESINGHWSWDENPFVWIIEFRRID